MFLFLRFKKNNKKILKKIKILKIEEKDQMKSVMNKNQVTNSVALKMM